MVGRIESCDNCHFFVSYGKDKSGSKTAGKCYVGYIYENGPEVWLKADYRCDKWVPEHFVDKNGVQVK